ncbi:uncharacterized protein LOC124678369 isoform X2 [Lolium rigidum]|uniref:uncharacterized protein LOC124678369 isoform X2 n=1 Tax=Lolium rigidum TaxID=89674 RepID=UPI001F5C800E|nr:uncharacterized protein LOC124678369 isoform X2 [Lolium rigidum]
MQDTCEGVGNGKNTGGSNPLTVSGDSTRPFDASASREKQYRKELGPILETTNEEEGSEEKVDYGSSDSEGAATSVQYINPGQGILALAVPSLQRERNDASVLEGGSQPEAGGTQEDPLSQVDNPEGVEATATRTDEYLPPAGGGAQTIRMSSRIISQDLHSIKIADKATKTAAARDVSGSHGEKDADELRRGADGLLKLATASRTAGEARTGPGRGQRTSLMKQIIWRRKITQISLDAFGCSRLIGVVSCW